MPRVTSSSSTMSSTSGTPRATTPRSIPRVHNKVPETLQRLYDDERPGPPGRFCFVPRSSHENGTRQKFLSAPSIFLRNPTGTNHLRDSLTSSRWGSISLILLHSPLFQLDPHKARLFYESIA